MRIVVREIINEPGHAFEEGQKVHDVISPVLARGEEAEVDFEGVRFIGVPFLNASVGQLLKDHPKERVNALLRVRNLEALYQDLLVRVIEAAHRYYTEPRYREAVERSLTRMFEEE